MGSGLYVTIEHILKLLLNRLMAFLFLVMSSMCACQNNMPSLVLKYLHIETLFYTVCSYLNVFSNCHDIFNKVALGLDP